MLHKYHVLFLLLLPPPQSGLGMAALTAGTLHTLLFGWDRAFDPGKYHFCLPPTFMVVLPLPLAVLCSRLAFCLPCLAARLARIRRGWEKSRHLRFVPPEEGGGGGSNGGVGNGRSLEDVSDV